MNTHNLTFDAIDRHNFEWIASGIKQYESRAGSDIYATFATGDTIIFNCGSDITTKQILEVQHFNTLEELLASIPVKEIMSDNPSPEDAKARWMNYPEYPERIKKYGIYVWKLANLPDTQK